MLLRGQRREAGLFEESMGSKASKSLTDISIALASGNVKDIEIELNKIQINIKNKDNTYRCLEDILADVSEWHKEKVKQEETKSKMDKLEELCRPISDYLRNNYNIHSTVVITDDMIKLVRDEIGIPVNRDSEDEETPHGVYGECIDVNIYSRGKKVPQFIERYNEDDILCIFEKDVIVKRFKHHVEVYPMTDMKDNEFMLNIKIINKNAIYPTVTGVPTHIYYYTYGDTRNNYKPINNSQSILRQNGF